MKKIKSTIQLNTSGIDQASELLQEWMYGKNVQSRNLQRTRLAFETILIDLSEHYGEEHEATLILRRRLGMKTVSLCYDGEPYNPVSHSGEDGSDEWTERFLSDIMMKPHWKHSKGSNELYLRIPRNKLRDELLLLIALVVAILLGFAGMYLPSNVTSTAMEYVFEPISTLFMNLLKTLAG
ncbi:MAG: hypothetical protein IKQ97_05320, partial [Eubacterium sp.]|nr:hypothetical protein [Eubacterium sp.]